MFIAIAAYLFWVIWGIIWLLPRKRALLATKPGATNDDLIRLGKAGHAGAQLLRRDTWRYIAVGLLIGLLLTIIRAAAVKGS